MDFEIGAKEKALRYEIAQFARAYLPANWAGITLIDQMSVRDGQFEMEMSKKLAQKGWLVMGWPKEYGGQAASVSELTEYDIGMAYWRIPGSGMGIGGVHWVGPSLMVFGTDEQKKKYLPPIAAGEPDGYWCTGYSEPNAGSDFANLQTRATREGDYYIINGQKVWTSEAHRARWCWLAVRTDPSAPKKHRGLSIIMVDLKSPGVNVNPLLNYYGRHHFNEVFFDNVKVPVANLVGQENQGWYQLMHALAFERRMAAPITYGGFKRLFEEVIEYVKTTKHEGQLLSNNPIIRAKLADIAVDLEILKLFAYQITWVIGKGSVPTYEASRNKVLNDDAIKRIAFAGAEILGGYSQVDPDSKWARVKGMLQGTYLGFPGNLIGGGTTEVEKSIIAQFKLGLPKSY